MMVNFSCCEMLSPARRTSDSDGGNVFSSRRGDHCNSLPQNGDRCIMAPFYEIGRIFIRFHSAHPQKEKRFVGLGRFSHSPAIAPICHTASFTHWSYETQNQNQGLRNVFFYTRLAVAQLGTAGNTRAQANFSDSVRLFEDHLRLLPGTVPSSTHFLLVSPSDPYPAFATVHLHEISYLDATGPTVFKRPSPAPEISTQPPPSEPLQITTTTTPT